MDYSKVTMVEYQKKKKAILNSLGRVSGECIGIISCNICPFGNDYGGCKNNLSQEMENPLELIKLVIDYEITIDWSEIEVDTLILVKSHKEGDWVKRYFAKYEDGMVFAFRDGRTSQTANGDNDILNWRHAKLVDTKGKVSYE